MMNAPDLQPNRKREREQLSDESSAESEADSQPGAANEDGTRSERHPQQYDAPLKRVRVTHYQEELPGHGILHRVHCRGGDGHQRHEHKVYYLDTPRLLAGDSKASALRGKQRVSDIESYLDENPNITFLVHRHYSCNDYGQMYKDSFTRLPVPRIDPNALAAIRPYFFSLDIDGEDAVAQNEDIEIVSSTLQRAMMVVEEAHPDYVQSWANSPLHAPYSQFYHSRHILTNLLNDPEGLLDSSNQAHIAAIFHYVTSQCETEWNEADELFSFGQVTAVHFDKLFGPDEVVVTLANDHPVAYVCTRSQRVGSAIHLECESWAYEGLFYKVTETIEVQWPHNQKLISIDSLSVYPLKRDRTGLEQRLQTRGELFWTCRRRRFVSYEAPKSNFEIQTSKPRYMIDTKMWYTLHKQDYTPRDDLGAQAMEDGVPPLGLFCILLPHRIRGYGMHDKKWIMLNVEQIRKVEWNEKAFQERLVLSPQKKELIEALITVHIQSKHATTSDIIEGKGKGLIILLHGGPGTGKTLTAESVAELAHKPLYRVTCGDIGIEPEVVEKYLTSVLHVGAIWECVVLLDEADVFLEERTQTDLQRNALVSVFLRALEYYEGLLILTSNRIGTFDEAFMSRIQLAMHYPSLNEEGRFQIWNNFIETLKDEVENINYSELRQKRDLLARCKLNGRQIRNTVNTARQLAFFQGKKLGYSHFHQAIEVANEFEDYIEKTHGHTTAEWAAASRLRAENS